MVTRAEAIAALSNSLDVTTQSGQSYEVEDPINGNSNVDSAYVFDFQYAGNSQPIDMNNQYSGWTAFTAAEKAQYQAMLDYVESIVNVDFQQVFGQSDPTMNVGKVSLPGNTAGVGGYNFSVSIQGGNARLTDYDSFVVYDNGISLDSGQDHLILHEIMHALSLKHPFQGNDTLPAAFESNKYSVLSYSSNPDNGQRNDGLQLFDILAAQARWGANLTTATGDDSYTGSRNTTVDTIWDAGGTDTFDASSKSSAVNLSLEEATFSTFDSLNDVAIAYDVVIENAKGGSGNDTITGNSAANELRGGAGNDTIDGASGNDRVYDNSGNDIVDLGSGNDYVRVGGGVDNFDGGSGKDYISYYDSSGGVTLNLSTNSASGSWASNDTITNFESVSGSSTGGDNITGTSGANTIKTYGGNDKVYAGSGSDIVELGSGNDYVRVGGGNESFDGGSGKDYISYYDSSNGIRIDLRDDEVSRSWAVNDTIKDFESASGSKTGDDTMLGTDGSNTLRGYGGDDKLYGRGGGDKMEGGSGDDRFDGGHGNDILTGGAGADVFHFDRTEDADTITDFENNIDTIELDNFEFSTVAEALSFADEIGDDVVFMFNSSDTLTVEDTTIAALQNDLSIV